MLYIGYPFSPLSLLKTPEHLTILPTSVQVYAPCAQQQDTASVFSSMSKHSIYVCKYYDANKKNL